MRMKKRIGGIFFAVFLAGYAIAALADPPGGRMLYAEAAGGGMLRTEAAGGMLCSEAAGGMFRSEAAGGGMLCSESADGAMLRTEAGTDPAQELPELSLYASAAVLMDAGSGRVLYGKNAYTPMAMASTTKIMTCILVLEHASPDETLTVSSYAAGMPQVKLYIKKGEEYTVRDLLYSMMLESHNDSAVALAEHVGHKLLGDGLKDRPVSEYTAGESREAVAAFARLMNEKAALLGCENTWFITPNGLDAEENVVLADGSAVSRQHCTTAAELARIMAYCIGESEKSGDFLEITRTPSYSFYANGRSFSCVNHNAFLNMMDGALSGKTGFTNKAGYCYVGALENDGRTFVVALLACGWPSHKTYKWSDTRKLMEYGIENYFYRSFRDEDVAFDASKLKPVPVSDGQTASLGDTAYAVLRLAEPYGKQQGGEGILMRRDERIEVVCDVADSLTAPVEKGARVGTVEYRVDGKVYRMEEIVTAGSVERIDLWWCARKILERYLISGENRKTGHQPVAVSCFSGSEGVFPGLIAVGLEPA